MQERKYGHICVHTGRVSNTYSRIRTARARVHGWFGTEKQRRRVHGEATECVVFMGRQRNASCSWGGNRMRRVHGEATECVVFMGRQRNASCSLGGNGTRGSQPAGSERNVWSCSSRGLGRNRRWKRGLVYRTTDETDLLCSERGAVDREECGVLQNVGNRPPTVETGVLLIGRGVAYRKIDETDLLRLKWGSC